MCKWQKISRMAKKTYQTCLDGHTSVLVEDIAKRTGCSISSIIGHATKELCRRYDMAKR